MKFAELDKKTQIRLSTIPQCVFATVNPDDETPEQVMERQDKFLKLPEKIQDKLLSEQVSKKIQQIGKHYGLSLLQMAAIARLIRSYYFGQIKEKDFAGVLMKEMNIDLQKAQQIARYVVDTIIKVDGLASTSTKIKLTLERALEKYPKIKDQVLAEKKIKIMGRPYLVKATVDNWIKDYRSVVGADNNDVMKRSAYLYNGENTGGLSELERQRLAELLKALDEGNLLLIDEVSERIIFEADKNGKENVDGVNSFANEIKPQRKIASGGVNYENTNEAKRVKSFGEQHESVATTNGEFTKKNVVKNATNQSSAPTIKHIQGNNWELTSHNFEKNADENNEISRKKKGGLIKKIFPSRKKQKDDLKGAVSFSAAQQFPVEKKNITKEVNLMDRNDNDDLNKKEVSAKKKNFSDLMRPDFSKSVKKEKENNEKKSDSFGRIGPIDY